MLKYFFIKTNGKYVKICYQDILYVEGSRNYTKIITATKQYLVLLSMKRLEQFLPVNLFKRIHKSFIVSLDKIIEFDKEMVKLKDKDLPIGHHYRNELEKSVPIVNDTTEVAEIFKPYYIRTLKSNEIQNDKLIVAG